jgi:hypothetical protein
VTALRQQPEGCQRDNAAGDAAAQYGVHDVLHPQVTELIRALACMTGAPHKRMLSKRSRSFLLDRYWSRRLTATDVDAQRDSRESSNKTTTMFRLTESVTGKLIDSHVLHARFFYRRLLW